jgi:hypothetical protein
MIFAQLTPTQRECIERSKAFHAKIAARAVPQKPAAERSVSVKGEYVPAPVQAAPAPPQGLPPQAMPAEPDPPPLHWFRIIDEVTPSVAEIQEIVARHFGVTRKDILSGRRLKGIVLPRHVAMYMAKELTKFSFPALSRYFGGVDHTSTLFAFRKIGAAVLKDEDMAFHVAFLFEKITGVQQ